MIIVIFLILVFLTLYFKLWPKLVPHIQNTKSNRSIFCTIVTKYEIFINFYFKNINFDFIFPGIKFDLESDDIDANIVAGLLKQYLRELPGNLLTQKLQHVFDSLVGNSHCFT